MYLNKLLNMAPWQVFVFVYFIDFGIICALMCFEELRGKPVRARHKFLTFIINDTLVIPGLLATRAYVVQRSNTGDSWYSQSWWYLAMLGLGVLISVGLEVVGVKEGDFTLRQEFSPSKLYHTIVFGPVFAAFVTSVPVVVMNRPAIWTLPLAAAFVVAEVAVLVIDGKLGHRQNAHCDWYWLKMRPIWLDD